MKYLILIATLAFLGCSNAQKQNVKADSNSTPPMTAQKVLPKAAMQKPKPNETNLTCKNTDETRKLEIAKESGGCSLNYTKSGKTSSVATSSVGTKHCETAFKKIRQKLEKAGFECS